MLSAPFFEMQAVLEAERPNVEIVQHNLNTLTVLHKQLVSANALFNFAKQSDAADKATKLILIDWEFMAVHTGAILIYDFYETKQRISKIIGPCPEFRSLIDQEKMKEANRSFDELFKEFAEVRLRAAHTNYGSTPKQYKETALFEGATIGEIKLGRSEGGTFIGGAIVGDAFHTTINNKVVGYRLNDQTVANMEKVLALIFDAFFAAEDALEARYRKRQ